MTSVRKMQLVRFGIWTGAATLAVAVAAVAANSERGVRRISALLAPQTATVTPGTKGPNAAAGFDAERETRKLVERAKGMLMTAFSMSEPDAFKWIQRAAMDNRMTMKQVAEKIISENLPGAGAPAAGD